MRRTANPARGQEFLRGIVAELRRVTWPPRDEWVAATILTVVLVVFVGLFTYLIDQLFGFIFKFVGVGS